MNPETPESLDDTVSVLFVCLGNICRSPLAEGVFLHLLEREEVAHRFQVDSAGTGAYHVGESPDPRSVDVARRNGITLRGKARQVEASDFRTFDYVLAMDRSNLQALESLRPDEGGGALHLLRDFDSHADGDGDRDVPDPYYGGPGGFDRIYEMIDRSCRVLLEEILDDRQ